MNSQKKCPNCGTHFDGRSNQTYCSSKCKTQAFRVNKSQDLDQPLGLSRPVTLSSRLGVSKVDKTALELERLRLLNIERIKEMEYKELDRQRQFEADQQKRRFEEERDREEWRLENSPPAPASVPEIDNSSIIKRLDELTSKLTLSRDHKYEEEEDEEEQEAVKSSGWETPALVIGGLLLSALFFSNKNQPPPKPALPKSASFGVRQKPPKTDSETSQ